MVAACAAVADTQSGITVTGSAEISVQPDIAFVTLGVSTQDVNAAAAAQSNAGKTSAVIAAVMKLGIAKADIETVGYSVSPIIDYQRNPPVTTGYSVTNQVRVRATDLTKTGAIIDTALAAGANNVQGVSFTLADDSQPRQKALAEAVRKAEAKARTIAETLHVALGKVVSASESSGFTPRPVEYSMAKSEAATTPIIPGEVQVSANVTLVFAIL